MTTEKCPICGKEAKHDWFERNAEDGNRLEEWFDCPHCGFYEIPKSSMLPYLFSDKTEQNTYYVSCYLNETKSEHDSNNPIRLSSEVLNTIVRQVPKTVEDKIERLLQYINHRTRFFGDDVEVDNEAIYSLCAGEASNIVKELTDLGILKSHVFLGGNSVTSLTMKGCEFIKERQNKIQKDKCFVAMWFNDKMNKVYNEIIVPACLDAGYQPVRVDRELYNGDITDKIISSVRTTAFTVADFSGNRGGVYYEAGFARGLGKEVIMTCNKEWFDGNLEENKKVHFDINHINIIVWDSDNMYQFKEKLSNRIIATIGRGSFIPV